MPSDQPLSPATTRSMDPLATEFNGGVFALFDLYRASTQAGGGAILDGRTFRDCVIQGPALMLVLENTVFESTNFGPVGGDMRSMLFRSLNGFRAIGAIPVGNCTFVNCQFDRLGITGNEELLQMLVEQVRTIDQ